jgi:hypothetical protein
VKTLVLVLVDLAFYYVPSSTLRVNPIDQDTVLQGREASKQATDLIARIQQSRLVPTTAPLEERRQTLDRRITTLEREIQRRDSSRFGRFASSLLGPKSSDAEALRESFKPIGEKIGSVSNELGALLRVSADLEVKQKALRERMQEESAFARISPVETKSEQQTIPSVSPTSIRQSYRRLSDTLQSLVQLASQLKDWLDKEIKKQPWLLVQNNPSNSSGR